MMSDLPTCLELTAVLDPRPKYRGTSHEDSTARAMGFRAALLPGVFVYGHATRLAVIGWGEDWLGRGRARIRFRRPVYDGDPLVVERGPLLRDEVGISATITVTNPKTHEVVLDGFIGLADRSPAPPSDLPILSTLEPKVTINPGGVAQGLDLGSSETRLDRETVVESLADFHETETIFADRGLIHSGCLIRKTMGDALANLILPMPVIFAGVEVQHLAPAPMGDRYRTSSRIVRAWEGKGKHYFETEEWLLADGRPVARHIRQNLYAMN
ncbi:hypothetical protein C9427_21640 [Mesorhizobium helmanticense]|uniref:MaoC-like domain-containing protein n=2 Tax=Mesorhizobium helmanticense TaxID=1776423 RepID=A0A2T4IRL2_9HYPH|nr:hypothetical protein C9427_21640 [Mesorhizobium helmanticense]